MATVLKVKDLHVSFGALKAVNGVSYELERGECLAIVGESGSGKSVHAFAIMRLISEKVGKIDQGEVEFDQRNLLDMPMREFRSIRGRRISMVFQDPISSLNPVLTIGDQITEVLRHHLNLNDRDSKTRAEELLRKVGIPDPARRLDNFPHELSGGMRQRVMIAIALACEPDIVIADEPTTALDVTVQAQIVELFKKLRNELGLTIVWISHDLGVVAGLADTVQVMYAGQIVERGPVTEIYERPQHPYTVGLLNSMPRLDSVNQETLTAIPGRPPDMASPPSGCAFAERCPLSTQKCTSEMPSLLTVREQHLARCWHIDKVGELNETRRAIL